jgi:Uma2 family endonuclease
MRKVVTYEEWLRMPIAEGKEEVVDGEIINIPTPKWEHAVVVHQLQMTLADQLPFRSAMVTASKLGLVIRKKPLICRQPDLAVFVRDNVVLEDGYVRSAPELIAEVLSEIDTREDMLRRIEDYEILSLPELWVLSPPARSIEVLQLQDGKLRTAQIVNSGQLHPLRFPETVVDVASVWPD